MAASDCFALASLWEGSPNVILEAWAAQVPVVATAVCGTPELIENNATGLLVPPANPRAMANALIKTLNDKDLAARFAKEAQKRLTEHSPQKMTQQTQALYEEIL